MCSRWLTDPCTSLTFPFRTLVKFVEMLTNCYADEEKALPDLSRFHRSRSCRPLCPSALADAHAPNPAPSLIARKFTYGQRQLSSIIQKSIKYYERFPVITMGMRKGAQDLVLQTTPLNTHISFPHGGRRGASPKRARGWAH